ncbi:DinB family protein [bacterium]|nr:DinB family protein [bacterium]
MNWTELLTSEVNDGFGGTKALMAKVEGLSLDWKPATGNNWMTMGQLLLHLATACGEPAKCFVTNDWSMPDGADMSEMSMEEMMPPAEKFPAVGSVAEALEKLAADKEMALKAINDAGEEKLNSQPAPAPWDPRPLPLGMRVMQMIQHQQSHKSQLFYYLKLQGVPVNTGDLWGGEPC